VDAPSLDVLKARLNGMDFEQCGLVDAVAAHGRGVGTR